MSHLTTFIFDKGQLKMIPLPEIRSAVSKTDYMSDKERQQYHEACAYAREHPIDVDEKDKKKIYAALANKGLSKKQMKDPSIVWVSGQIDPDTFERTFLKEHTEYKLEGVRMEIKEEYVQLDNLPASLSVSGYQKQIACLIEDDKQ